ncbi:serine hydrolase domain-containing protein [Aminobacter carboxidus]|uniref:Beta-lactamase family protein n=1 Tax=Aminobacter carboxidus TaxID=376165 RepID=A0ABR9GXJ2_9HYPH|nr:serine hydrolase domain-containing protein [Aminobacter carboxidus]MBE1208335.1 beta-lactamase family protein [Aminobacter carboxidus]
MLEELNRLFETYRAEGAVGASFAFALGDGDVIAVTSGLADRPRNIAVTPDHLFKIGSCTKTFVAAALMKLAEDGKVDLGRPISTWFPDLPRAGEVSVRQLINHRGGLPEFEYDIPMDPSRSWTPSQLVDLAFSVGGQKAPGGPAVYNNTGYVLAGMLIEAVSGLSLGAYVRAKVLDPLGLKDTWSPATESFPTERMVRGYYHRPKPASNAAAGIADGGEMWRMDGVLPYSDELQDSSDSFPFSGAYGCGDMVSTPRDMVRFMRALFSGSLLPAPLFREMSEDRAEFSFPGTRMRETGTGLFQSSYADLLLYGHQGGIPGYVTVMQHEPKSGLTVAMTCNAGSGNRLSHHAGSMHPVFDQAIRVILRG